MLERREQHADERILAMDAMIREREKRADKRLQSLADMIKLRTLETDDRLGEIMQALREKRGARNEAQESIMESTAVATQTPPTSSNPPPMRPYLKTRCPQARDSTASRTAQQLRPPVMALKPPQTYERKSKPPNPYARYHFHDTST